MAFVDPQQHAPAGDFAAVLASLQLQNQALQQLLTRQSSTPANTSSIVSHNLTFERFDPKEEEFSNYLERFDNFLDMRGVLSGPTQTPEQIAQQEHSKTTILLGCLHRNEFMELKSTFKKDRLSEVPYDDIITELKKRHDRSTNLTTQRYKFAKREQLKAETISDYVSALKLMNQRCKWPTNTDDMNDAIFQTLFIGGLTDHSIREKLLQNKDLTLEQAIETALALETAKKENIEEFKSSSQSYNTVHRLQFDSHSRKSRSQFRGRPDARSYDRHRSKSAESSKSKTYNRDFLTKLGISDVCLACGKTGHKSNKCSIRHKLKCSSCDKSGHIAKVCIKTKSSSAEVQQIEYDLQKIVTSGNDTVFDISLDHRLSEKIHACVELDGITQQFEVDTGAAVSIISAQDFRKLKLNREIHPCPHVRFRAYNNQYISPQGYISVNVKYKHSIVQTILFIVKEPLSPILGRVWIRKLQILKLDSINCVEPTHTINLIKTTDIINNYPEVFGPGVGKIPNVTCSLKLRPDAKPVYVPARTVPYLLVPKVDAELDALENLGIIEKVDYCQWGTPLVIVPKADGTVRICADYSATVNPQLIPARHPIPKVEDLFHRLHKSTLFCVLDISKAYLHIELDEESSFIAALSTHRGAYRTKRLFFGLASAPSIFHSIIEPIVKDCPGVINYFDDFAVHGSTYDDCHNNLIGLLDRLKKFCIKLNGLKCRFFEKELKYLGHIISGDGLKKDPIKLKAIDDAHPPSNEKELESFLGFVTYYTKFIPNASTILKPLNALKGNVKFVWTPACQTAFHQT